MNRHADDPADGDFAKSRVPPHEWALAVRALWDQEPPPPISRVLTPAVLQDPEALAEVLCADITERNRHDIPWTVEHYAQAAPRVLEAPETRRALFMAAVTGLAPLGATLFDRAAALRAKFPQFSDDITLVESLTAMLSGAFEADLGLHPGETRGKYDLIEKLGSGAFAETWRARDRLLGRDVALKIIPPRTWTPHDSARFLAEARAVARVEHPSVVRLHEAGRFDPGGEFFLDMELVHPGVGARTLAELIERGPVEARHAARLASAIAHGLAAAHARGVLHRDIKPANVLLNASGQPRLADFGLAQEHAPGEHAGPGLAGTPAYIAPEMAAGQTATPLSDVYSLGATLRALVLGADPRPPSSLAEAIRDAASVPLPPVRTGSAALHPALAAIIDRACAHAPEHRYGSAGELASDLDAFLTHRPVKARPLGATGRAALWLRRHRAPAGVAGAALIVMIAGSALFVRSLWRERDAARRAEEIARTERDAAVEARDVIQTQNRFISRAFNSARGRRGLGAAGADVTLREALTMIEARTETAFADRPLVLAATLQFMAQANKAIGDLDAAQRMARRSAEVRVATLGAVHPDSISSRCTLASVLLQQRAHDEAFGSVRAIIRDIEGTDHWTSMDGLWARWAMTRVDEFEGRPDQAAATLELLADEYRRAPFDGNMELQTVLNDLVRHAVRTGRPDRAEAAQREIVNFTTTRLGAGDISTLNASRTLVELLRRRAALDEASALNADVLRRYRLILDPAHATILSVVTVQAEIDIERAAPEAVAFASEAVALTAERAPGHSARLHAGTLLGRAQLAVGDARGAEATLIAILEDALASSDDRAIVRAAADALAQTLRALARPDDAAAVEARFQAWDNARPR